MKFGWRLRGVHDQTLAQYQLDRWLNISYRSRMANNLPDRMVRARLDRKMTQAQLADVLGVRQSMVAMFEGNADAARPSDDFIKRVEAWIASGRGSRIKAPRGPRGSYKARRTIR